MSAVADQKTGFAGVCFLQGPFSWARYVRCQVAIGRYPRYKLPTKIVLGIVSVSESVYFNLASGKLRLRLKTVCTCAVRSLLPTLIVRALC